MTRTCVIRLIDAILKGIKEPGTTRMDNCCDDAHSVCRQFSTGPHFPSTHTIHVCVCVCVCVCLCVDKDRERLEVRCQIVVLSIYIFKRVTVADNKMTSRRMSIHAFCRFALLGKLNVVFFVGLTKVDVPPITLRLSVSGTTRDTMPLCCFFE